MITVDKLFDGLAQFGVASVQELILVTKMEGYTVETLNNLLFVRTGYRSFEQFLEYEFPEYELEA